MRQGRVVLHVVGILTAFVGLSMLLPAGVSWAYGEPAAIRLLAAALITAFAGVLLYRLTPRPSEISIRDGFAIVTVGWVVVGLFGTLPYVLTGSVETFHHAFFESMSGLTTTGATIVDEIAALPKGVVLWRSQTQWMGGMGIIVLSVAILPLLGVGGMQLLRAEIPGLAPDRLRPRVRQTASLLWGVYAVLTAAEMALLWFGGMSLFEAVNHGFTTMATGGFSTEDASIGAFDSAFLQYVIALFIFFAGVNFTLHYSWLTGNWRAPWRNRELRVYAVLVAGATAVLTLLVWVPGTGGGVEESFRAGLFQAVSIMTTTGYVTADYEAWIGPAQTLLFLLMLIGGCTGSTAGSIKVLRHMLVFEEARIALKKLLHPQGVFVYKLDGEPVSQDVLANVSGFLLLYLGLLATGVFALALIGLDVTTAIGAATATIGNVGPGFGLVGPAETYAPLPVASLWVLSALMLLGRLEIFTVIVLFTGSYWRR
ncbi:MAG: TrkH family potassium uptake protein [Gemmatimonadota bacterium]|nr:TrkH family potassium uptake protein [Gemmatimonadota bacterium]